MQEDAGRGRVCLVRFMSAVAAASGLWYEQREDLLQDVQEEVLEARHRSSLIKTANHLK